jgi:hypothetical protein
MTADERSLGSDGTRRTESALPFLPAVGVHEFGFFERAAARKTATRKDTDQENIKSSRTCEMGADSLGVESGPDRYGSPEGRSYFALKSPPPNGCTPSIL